MKPMGNRKRRAARLAGALLILLGLGCLGLSLARNVDPLVRDLAVTRARNAAAAAVQEAVAARMEAGELADLVRLEKDEAGLVAAAVTDVRRLNALQAALAADVIGRLTDPRTADLSIPLGNLLPTPLLSGLGPRLPVRILSVSGAEARLRSRFSAAGINQTLHRLLLELRAEIRVLIPAGTVETAVYVTVAVAERVIVGRVPDSYNDFEGDEKWDESLERYDIMT